MSRPQGEPTHYLPLWQDVHGDYVTALDTTGETWTFDREDPEALGIIPAERVTIAPEPYTPKVGDRVATTLGYEATIVGTELDRKGRIAVRWHTVDGDHYGTITPDKIDRSVQ